MTRKLLWILIAMLALAAGGWLALTRYAPAPPAAPLPEAFWTLSFPDPDGRPQALRQWRGQIVVLNFWASWCSPCREEMPEFADLRAKYRANGVEFVGIAIDNPGRVTMYLKDFPVNYPVLIGEGAAANLAERLGNASGALPYTIVIDRDGRVTLSHLGRLPREALDTALRRLAT